MGLTLVVLAAGLGRRYGGLKQLDPVGAHGELLLDYALYDASRAGFSDAVIVIHPAMEETLREHLARLASVSMGTRFAFQELERVPPGFDIPAGRRKPWGTGHAIAAAEPYVRHSFVVVNADDFYGHQSFAIMRDHFARSTDGTITDFALVGFGLEGTLSDFGGVSRGICMCTEEGFLAHIREVHDIVWQAAGIRGTTDTGGEVGLKGDEVVSMNMWGLTSAVFPVLTRKFAVFLTDVGDDPDAEFLIPMIINELVEAGEARVRILPGSQTWFGMTHAPDRARVMDNLRRLIDDGLYPENLFRSVIP